MAVKLEKVVPFGRSLDEYIKLFNLSTADLQNRILGVADGPASFNAEATQLGCQVTSIDPIYELSGAEIQHRFDAVVDNIIDQIKASPHDWVWSYHQSPEDLRQSRVNTLHQFLQDYDRGKQEGRYQLGALPHLDLADQSYDLALCSHFLFLYSEQFDLSFHIEAIQELLRVSREVRIFPLMTLMLTRSPYLDPVIQTFQDRGYTVTLEPVPYELQKGGNEMLRLLYGNTLIG